ncbi:MAG: hypothetical protein WKF96_00055 [Solirubrobacteraceae bacterium]
MPAAIWAWPDSTVIRVVDGDTFTALLTHVGEPVDLGFHATSTTRTTFVQRLRLNRINAMPKGSVLGKAATAFAEEWLERGPFLATTVGAYKYGDEWMVEADRDGENLSDLLIAGGFAVYWNGKGARPGG